MRARFHLLSATSAVMVAPPACATVYLTVPQAQQALFPGARLVADDRALTPDQVKAIKQRSGAPVLGRTVRSWRAPDGGRMFVDEVLGKHEFITIAVALNAAGTVRGVEVLDYRETYGGQVRDPAWLAQFVGKRDGAALALGKDVRNNSGGTLSAKHVTEGVRRLLATNSIVFAAR